MSVAALGPELARSIRRPAGRGKNRRPSEVSETLDGAVKVPFGSY